MDRQFQLVPEQASTMAPRVDALFYYITGVCVVFAVLIGVTLIYFAVRYRRVREDYFPQPLVGSKVLELTWSIIPLILALSMFFWGLIVFFDQQRTPDNSLDVYVTGKQWM